MKKLEDTLKKEFAAKERKAKADYKATQKAAEAIKPESAASKKRKLAEACNVNINITVAPNGQFVQATGQSGGEIQASVKRAKKAPTETATPVIKQPNPKKSVQNVEEKPRTKAYARKQAPSIATVAAAEMPVLPSPIRETKEMPRKKAYARKQAPSIAAGYPSGFPFAMEESDGQISPAEKISTKKEAMKKEPVVKREPLKKEPALKKEPVKKETKVKNEPGVKRETPVKKEPVKKEIKVKNEPGVKRETPVKKRISVKKEELPTQATPPSPDPSTSQFPPLGLINGVYDINCPYITEQWDSEDLQLILAVDGSSAWGSYDFGMFEGILHFPLRPFSASQEPLHCHWRGRENGEGEMSFGDDNVGRVQFLGGGNIHGTLNLSGDCEFWGARRPGPAYSPRSTASYRNEWESFNDEAYEQERVGRW